mmetsp:Transcript_2340/g.5226  ORF Transcript_2340/g.5226 Transcript_2340/m.5226 type:complete len:391 (+) Transcript_2340:126-1298(+)
MACCNACRGEGSVWQVVRNGFQVIQTKVQCAVCQGKGQTMACQVCKGTGKVASLFHFCATGQVEYVNCSTCSGHGLVPASGVPVAPPPAPPAPLAPPCTTPSPRKRVRHMSKIELQSELRKMCRKVSGNKPELRRRLEDVFETNHRGYVRREAQLAGRGRFLDAGTFRNVFLTYYSKGPRKGQRGVYKLFKDTTLTETDEDQAIAEDLRAVAEAGRIITAFNYYNEACGNPNSKRRVYLNQPEVWSMGEKKILVEPFIEGNYAKFNSNSGWVNNDYAMMQALSHFSFDFTHGRRLLCDLQGGGYDTHYLLTDPAIVSTAKEFGGTDGGAEFMENFFANHVCNEYCSPHWSRIEGARVRRPVRAGTSFFNRPIAAGRSTVADAAKNPCFHR